MVGTILPWFITLPCSLIVFPISFSSATLNSYINQSSLLRLSDEGCLTQYSSLSTININ
jgi:hypothetical protein